MNLFRNRRRSRGVGLVAGLLALGLVAAACGGGAATGEAGGGGGEAGGSGGGGKSLTIGYITWAEDIAATYLWEHILEKRGYEVKLTQAGVGPTFAGVASGDIQLFFDMWLPLTHKQYKEQYGDQMIQLTQWYDKATLEIAVPEYLKKIDSIGDLRGKAEMFDGKIVGIEPGAGLTDVTKSRVIPQYNLKAYRLATSSTTAMLAALESATKAKEPIVVTLWRPHWAYAAYPIKDLKDPKGALGEAEHIYAVAPTGFKEEYPQVAKWVSNFHMTPEQLGPLENMVVNKADSAQERRAKAAKWASNHQDLISQWVGSSG